MQGCWRAARQGVGSLPVLCGTRWDVQGTKAVVGTMHRKLERAEGRQAAGGREPLRSTQGCKQAAGGFSAELGPA